MRESKSHGKISSRDAHEKRRILEFPSYVHGSNPAYKFHDDNSVANLEIDVAICNPLLASHEHPEDKGQRNLFLVFVANVHVFEVNSHSPHPSGQGT